MKPASTATRGNFAFLMKEDWLTSGSSLNSPGHSNDASDTAAVKESILFNTRKDLVTREPLVQITDWDAHTLPNQRDESLKHSRYKIGGSADSILSLTSSQTLLPLEWKILRSSQSQGTLAHFSSATSENTSEKHKTASGNEQETIDDIIGDEVAFKICSHVLNHNFGASYTVDSQKVFPIVCNQSAGFKEADYLKQCSQCIPLLCSETEAAIPEAGMQANKTINSAVDLQDSSLIDHLWTPEMSAKNLKNVSVSTGLENDKHETEESPALTERLLKSPAEKRCGICQPMSKLQIEDQILLQRKNLAFANNGRLYRKEKSVLNEEQPTYSPLKFECSSPINLQRQIVNLKNQNSNLQEANETAVLELAKADEEISHMKNETTQFKHEYLQKLADCKEENLALKEKINRVNSRHNPVDTYEQALHEEIYELRCESRRLREINHQLNEENHKLKEQLWDIKRQYEWLVNVFIGKQDEELPECSRNNASPSSINSESTDTLIARCCNKGVEKEIGNIEGDISEINMRTNLCCIRQPTQSSHENHEQDICNPTSRNFSHLSTGNKYSPKQVPLDKAALSRRPFAPRNVTDLKVGNLVKFSCPTGKISKGMVKYLGPLLGREEDYVGIELEGDQLGRHDGTFQGTRYFLCAPNKGVFVNFSKVIIAWE